MIPDVILKAFGVNFGYKQTSNRSLLQPWADRSIWISLFWPDLKLPTHINFASSLASEHICTPEVMRFFVFLGACFAAGLPRPNDPTFDPNQSQWRARYGSVSQHQTSETSIEVPSSNEFMKQDLLQMDTLIKKNSCRFWGKVCSYLYLFICDLWFLFQILYNEQRDSR